MNRLYIRVSKTGYVKGWGSKWVAGLSPVERDLVKAGHLVLVVNGVSKIRGLPPYRVVKYYGRYGYCPRVIDPRFKRLAEKAIKTDKRYRKLFMAGYSRPRLCSQSQQEVPF